MPKLQTLSYGIFFCLLELVGDIEFSPEPGSSQSFSVCYWNLSVMSAHKYHRISLLTTCMSAHNFSITCLSETYLTSSIDINDGNYAMPEYIMCRINHPSDVKRGGVYIYYKTIMPLKVLLTKFLLECFNFEVII